MILLWEIGLKSNFFLNDERSKKGIVPTEARSGYDTSLKSKGYYG